MRLALTAFLPFALGYFLSFLFRSLNAVVAPALRSELGLDDAASAEGFGRSGFNPFALPSG